MSVELTRRQFLKLAGIAAGGLVAKEVAEKFGMGTSRGAGESTTSVVENGRKDEKKEATGKQEMDSLGEFLEQRVPRGFQVDCLPGMGVFVEKGAVLLLPMETGRLSSREELATNLYRRLEARVVADSLVAEERQFLPIELERLNKILSDWVMPYLNKFAPEKATTGIVLISRAPDDLAASYAKEAEHLRVVRLDYFTVGNNAFSYYRDKNGKMILTNTSDGKMYGRRIYLLKEPSSSLREKMTTGNFLTSPEWTGYYFNNMWGMAHEILHLIVTSEYDFPPFDNHAFVRSLSLACVLEFRRGKKKEWDKGPIADALWLMPELQALKIYPDFYKDLFAKLREGKPIETINFDEEDVYQKSEDLFAGKGLGSFKKRWEEWKKGYGKTTTGTLQEDKWFDINFEKLALTSDEDNEL